VSVIAVSFSLCGEAIPFVHDLTVFGAGKGIIPVQPKRPGVMESDPFQNPS
jgi:hypothetical protein